MSTPTRSPIAAELRGLAEQLLSRTAAPLSRRELAAQLLKAAERLERGRSTKTTSRRPPARQQAPPASRGAAAAWPTPCRACEPYCGPNCPCSCHQAAVHA